MRYKFIPKSGCGTCDGSGFICTGTKAGFDVKNMEVVARDDGHRCQECEEYSQDAYDHACEMRADDKRSGNES